MDALRPGHAHRSSSDRLLNNYLDSQKHLSTSLLTLLSHSHSSSSSLLAYVTSSPGVNHPVRRSVRHAGFEGPLSASLAGGGDHHENGGNIETQGWSAYVSSLDAFRKDLKQIHLLEEELSRVKRDREILVTRLIKTTKSRPKKSDLSAIAANYQVGSSRASVSSMTSNGSSASKMSKREGKLADAQAELLGCEEHLRSLEVRIEQERNQVMNRGLEDRFRAMEAVGRMWVSQSQRGMQDLEKAGDLPADAYELDSNHSLAPSQSASQIAYEDSPSRSGWRGGHRLVGPGSIAGSIAEENEESSDDGNQRNLTVHENRPGSRASAMKSNGPSAPTKSFPSGVPSVNSRARPLSSTALAQNNQQSGGNDSDSDVPNNRAGGRRAASDVGGMGYHPPTGRQPLRRTFSAEGRNQNGRAGSDRSSIRSGRSGGGKKKKGFFASISRMFKGSKRQDRSGSPPYGSGSKSWHTRTDSNIKRSSMFGSTRGRGGDDSSSDDDNGNFVSVSNNRQSGTWSVDQVGRAPSRASVKRSSSGPVASGLIPQKPTRANMKRESSQSTITGRDTPRSGAATPTLASQKAKSGGFPAASGFSSGTIPRSNTARSTISVASARSNNTVKSNGTATANKTRPNGSIARSATEPKNIMSLVDNKSGPTMPEVPKAPKSQVNPQMSLPTAPGSSLVAPQKVGNLSMTGKQTVSPTQTAGGGIARSQSMKSTKSTATVPKKAAKEAESATDKPTTPLPPSRLAPAPLKSALRPKSPGPPSAPAKPVEQPKNMFSISAPGPVNLPEQTPEPFKIPAAKNKPERPISAKRNSFQSNASVADGNSVYESAMEDGGNGGGDESSGSESDTEDYKVVDNERVKRLGINVGPPEIQRVPSEQRQAHQDEHEAGADSDTSVDTATHKRQSGPPPTLAPVITTGARTAPSESGSTVARRKSVRMAVPDSPGPDSEFQTDRAPSPVADAPREQSQWKSRIGDMREDTSDESDHDPEYLAARKGLSRNSGQFEQGADGKRKKTGTSRSGSVKSKSSVRGK